MTTDRYAFIDQDEDGFVSAYPASDPYVTRDQGARAADELVAVVIGDVADVLRSANFLEEADKADALYAEACALWPDGLDGWLPEETENGSEILQSILEEAENLPHAYVVWDGDCGTVRITTSIWVSISDPARQLTDDEIRSFGIEL